MFNQRRNEIEKGLQGKARPQNARGRKNYARERHTAYKVSEETILMDFLIAKMGGMSKTSVKALLTKRRISVNGAVESLYNTQLKPGDIVEIDSTNTKYKFSHPKVSILYEDNYILVINKGVGLLSVASPLHEETTAFRIMMNYVKKQNSRNSLYVVHRIDRETSGVLIFAKDIQTQTHLKDHWHDDTHKRYYYALVEGEMEKDDDTITSWLTENPKSLKVHSSPVDDGGEKAITSYHVISKKKGESLLKVNIKTGKKNQIRVQLSSIGHPIVGDRKYGAKTSRIGRLGLHAASLTIMHPNTGEQVTFEAKIPKEMHL
ncbi:MAG: RluA family pseudouridine synthase [Paludibacteraceae bacterium]|nr:RluA family pseudouridine synthase [Paludibacteraceae bacterium]